jgi:hypothetical protein
VRASSNGSITRCARPPTAPLTALWRLSKERQRVANGSLAARQRLANGSLTALQRLSNGSLTALQRLSNGSPTTRGPTRSSRRACTAPACAGPRCTKTSPPGTTASPRPSLSTTCCR